ncbi:hypothetical protein AVM02_07030 [Brucella anthropi]|uniref:substrate-binding domain-containing protein n=1 Tax=Brucella anthropi TaxID=529 RepID=UPI0039872FD2
MKHLNNAWEKRFSAIRIIRTIVFIAVAAMLAGCMEEGQKDRLGISFGVGEAARWPFEMSVMVEHARSLGMAVDTRLNKGNTGKSQENDCDELIDAGATVLIVVPRDPESYRRIARKAHKKGVKVILYARPVHDAGADFYVGYDTYKIGQSLAQEFIARVPHGRIAILKGDPGDINSPALHRGVMRVLKPYIDDGSIEIVADEYVPDWSSETAKKLTMEVMKNNGGRVDGVLAFNDLLAGGAAAAVRALGVDHPVVIVGMDSEIAALRRLVRGEQAATMLLDLKAMAIATADTAHAIMQGKKPAANSWIKGSNGTGLDAYLVNGEVVTKENLDRLIIQTGIQARDTIYGADTP